jgi:hypothetical protein
VFEGCIYSSISDVDYWFCNLSVLIAAASVYVVVVEIAVESKNWFKMCILWFDL